MDESELSSPALSSSSETEDEHGLVGSSSYGIIPVTSNHVPKLPEKSFRSVCSSFTK